MNFTTLLALILTYAKVEFEQVIPTWILLAEATINRELKDYRAVVRADHSISTPRVEVPTDFGGAISFVLSTGQHLEWVSVAQMAEYKRRETGACQTGTPRAYTVVGGEFEFFPEPSAAVTATVAYQQLIGPLTAAAPTNWLLTAHPDLYLYGALMQSPLEQADAWRGRFLSALADAKRSRQDQGVWLRVGHNPVP